MSLVRIRTLSVAKLYVVRQLLEGQVLHKELILTQECPPHAVTQRRRTDQECPLPTFLIETQNLTGDKGLPESHLVGDDHTAGIAHQP